MRKTSVAAPVPFAGKQRAMFYIRSDSHCLKAVPCPRNTTSFAAIVVVSCSPTRPPIKRLTTSSTPMRPSTRITKHRQAEADRQPSGSVFTAPADRIGLAFKDPVCTDRGYRLRQWRPAVGTKGTQASITLPVGVDPAPACATILGKARAIETYVASLDRMPGQLGPFDGVILSHVLEHVLDLHQALQGVRAIVKPGGVLYVEVPDATNTETSLPPLSRISRLRGTSTIFRHVFEEPCRSNRLQGNPGGGGSFGRHRRDAISCDLPVWTATASPKIPQTPDTELRKNIEQYVKQSKALINRMEKIARSRCARRANRSWSGASGNWR